MPNIYEFYVNGSFVVEGSRWSNTRHNEQQQERKESIDTLLVQIVQVPTYAVLDEGSIVDIHLPVNGIICGNFVLNVM